MSCLFFAVRPAYLLLEGDTGLLRNLFWISPDLEMIHRNLAWAAWGLVSFIIGAWVVAHFETRGSFPNQLKAEPSVFFITTRIARLLLIFQFFALLLMSAISLIGRGIYSTSIGAYATDFPTLLQAVHLFTCITLFIQWRNHKSSTNTCFILLAMLMFFIQIIFMRNVSMFRGFYITGALILGIACLAVIKPKVHYAWLVIPVVLFMPLFQWLGQTRGLENDEIAVALQQNHSEMFTLSSYWNFFDGNGDMNIFDTFVAASERKPAFHPYLLSWLYVPFHFVPRAIWKNKPASGITQDVAFTMGAPYSPGIVGFFVLDGGRVWMLGCMFILGAIINRLDRMTQKMPIGPLKYCAYGILVINAMYLTRFFLWQYTYQILETLVPCILLSRFTQGFRPLRALGRDESRNLIQYNPKKQIGRGQLSIGRQIALKKSVDSES